MRIRTAIREAANDPASQRSLDKMHRVLNAAATAQFAARSLFLLGDLFDQRVLGRADERSHAFAAMHGRHLERAMDRGTRAADVHIAGAFPAIRGERAGSPQNGWQQAGHGARLGAYVGALCLVAPSIALLLTILPAHGALVALSYLFPAVLPAKIPSLWRSLARVAGGLAMVDALVVGVHLAAMLLVRCTAEHTRFGQQARRIASALTLADRAVLLTGAAAGALAVHMATRVQQRNRRDTFHAATPPQASPAIGVAQQAAQAQTQENLGRRFKQALRQFLAASC